jgi:hypothetical protein
MGKGSEKDAQKEAGLISEGGILGALTGSDPNNPLAAYSFANPLPVSVTNASALGGMGGGFGQAAPTNFLDSLMGGSFFGGTSMGEGLPVNMVSANDDIFGSITNGIMGIFGGGGGAGGGIGGILGSIMSIFTGGGSGLSFLSAVPNLLGFAQGGRIGDKAHIQAFARGGTVKGCSCRSCSAMYGGGKAGSGLEESIEDAMRRERAMSGGREPVLIVANKSEFIVPAQVATKLTRDEKSYLLGKSVAPQASIANYSQGGSLSAMAGSNISNQVTNNMNKSTSYRGGDVTYNEAGGGMNEAEARKLDAAITAKTMEILQKQRRPRGLLY